LKIFAGLNFVWDEARQPTHKEPYSGLTINAFESGIVVEANAAALPLEVAGGGGIEIRFVK
jgi:hypothetical protein